MCYISRHNGNPRLIQPTLSDYAYFSMTAATVYPLNENSVYLSVLPVSHHFTLDSSGIFEWRERIDSHFMLALQVVALKLRSLVLLGSNLLLVRIKCIVVIIKKPTQMSRLFLLNWSAREDSNLRPTGPKPVALPSCATRRQKSLHILNIKWGG